MYQIEPLTHEGISKIIRWNEGTAKEFLVQWSGLSYEYPITAAQIERKMDDNALIFEIRHQGEMLATIGILAVNDEKKEAHIGCYLLNPAQTGQGHGTAIVRLFAAHCFASLDLRRLTLKVFPYNVGAIKCYKKAGFQIVGEMTGKSGAVYEMALQRGN